MALLCEVPMIPVDMRASERLDDVKSIPIKADCKMKPDEIDTRSFGLGLPTEERRRPELSLILQLRYSLP